MHEGDLVNIDVTAPGATLALGLMFFNTGNKSVASWMNPPDTNYLLDLVRPDLLLLRVVARGLILWDSILPTKKWLDSQFPSSLAFDLRKGPKNAEDTEIDDEAIWLVFHIYIDNALLTLDFISVSVKRIATSQLVLLFV